MIDPCPDWVSAEPFRAHVRDLICQTGLSWRLIAAHAGVAPRAIRSLLHGRRGGTPRELHVSVARALAATSLDTISEAEDVLVESGPTRQLLAALRAVGHGHHLPRHLRPDDLACLDDASTWRCSRGTAVRMTACYDYLTQHPGPRRAVAPTPAAATVACSPHPTLDRKQASPWRTSGSTSPMTAETPRC